ESRAIRYTDFSATSSSTNSSQHSTARNSGNFLPQKKSATSINTRACQSRLSSRSCLLESHGRRGKRLRRRLLHQPIECKTCGYCDDDCHYTSDDERAHGERPSMSKNFASSSSLNHKHLTPSFCSRPRTGAPAGQGRAKLAAKRFP